MSPSGFAKFVWIIELEDLSIFCADLALIDTVKIAQGSWNAFQIIDFDIL